MVVGTRQSVGASIWWVSTVRPTYCAYFSCRTSSVRTFSASSELNLSIGPVDTKSPPQKKVLVPLGFGNEEIEVVVLIDVLRRAGADVLVASVEDNLQVESSRRVKIVADAHISSCNDEIFDLIALPGGMPGSARLQECQDLKKMTIEQVHKEKLVGAISMSPAYPLQNWGVLKTRMATCHPGFMDKLSPTFLTRATVQKDGCVTTSRGPGTVFDFVGSLLEQLYGEEKRDEVLKSLVLGSTNKIEPTKSEFNSLTWQAGAAPQAPQVLIPMAFGSEEMEAVIITNVLRRANMKVIIASIEQDLQIEASQKVKIIADKHIEDVKNCSFDIIILPGGMPGAEKLRDCKTLKKMLQRHIKEERPLGAICSAPAVVLEANGWLRGKKATCHPMFIDNMARRRVVKSRVVLDGNIVTSQGPGTAMEFGLCIVEKFFGKQRASSVARGLVFEYL